MTSPELLNHSLKPLLSKMPDARRASSPLFPALLFPFVALMAGSLGAGAMALYNAVLLRRWKLAANAILLGLSGYFLFLPVIAAAAAAGISNVHFLLLLARLFSILLGCALAWFQHLHVRGHEILEGKVIPINQAIITVFVVIYFMPHKYYLMLLGIQ